MQCILALLQCGPADDTDIRALCEWKASPQINSVDSDKQQYADTVLIYALRTMSAEQIEALIFGPERGLIARARSIGCVEQLFQVDNEGCTPLMHGAPMLPPLLLAWWLFGFPSCTDFVRLFCITNRGSKTLT